MKCLLPYLLIVLCFSCKNEPPLFESLSPKETNLYFQNQLSETTSLNILNYLYYYNGAGVAAGDFNNDGLVDLYFTANQSKDHLYLNIGGFKFKDITTAANIDNTSPWTTGVTTVDINNDGLLDIYVCKIGNYNTITGHNLLFVNNGIDKDGIPIFTEEAERYGLDLRSFSTQSAFFDMDKDGDLDLFVLNHSLHPNSNYGKGDNRNRIDDISGDKLLENINGKFIDITSQSGIFQGKIGYGLGLSISDINNDGYPDIYVGNDFFENDYLYMNQQNNTFKEVITSNISTLGHTSHYSMGNAIADLNNNGLQDIISLDMLPEDLETYKASGVEAPFQTYESYLNNGYAPQFMQNTLHHNNGNGTFSEIAFLSGIAATEWSWSPIIGDYDNDGFKDLYVTNGIVGATNDMDFINFISNETIQKQLATEQSERNLELSELIPEKKVENYMYQNTGDTKFKNVTHQWTSNETSFSNGGVSVDLDNDGDLDLVINNINEQAFVLKNNAENNRNNYLKIKFLGEADNLLGIGVKIKAFIKDQIITQENYINKGYLSSSDASIHIGLGTEQTVDSMHIIWPNGKYERLEKIVTNHQIIASIKNAHLSYNYYNESKPNHLEVLTDSILDFQHYDTPSIEFNRDPLVPYASTNTGPYTAVDDVNNDGLEDIFITGGKSQKSALYLQNKDGEFVSVQDNIFEEHAINEDTHALFFDANGDAYKDLIVVSGGNEFKEGSPLKPRLYINENGVFRYESQQFMEIETNASKVSVVDLDNDGDMDISIISNLIPWEFGQTPRQYIFENNGLGEFKNITTSVSTEFENIGNVYDIHWIDVNGDNFKDVIVVGHWMPITLFINNGEKLLIQSTKLNNTEGWWNTVKADDFDNDCDIDIIAGNWGLNTRLKASKEASITLYRNDFDGNGTIDPIVTYYQQHKETTLASKDELVKQLPYLNKTYLSYQDFAQASFNELFPKNKTTNIAKKHINELASCYFENIGNNTFKKHELPLMSQVSSVKDMLIKDFNNDGFKDVFLIGNNYHINTQLGKLDASHGMVLMNDQKGFFNQKAHEYIGASGETRGIEEIVINKDIYYIITRNNNSPIFLKLNK